MQEIVTTKRAGYILTTLDDGQVSVITSPHDGSEASRFVYRDMGSAQHWLKLQREHDAGLRHANQGLLKS